MSSFSDKERQVVADAVHVLERIVDKIEVDAQAICGPDGAVVRSVIKTLHPIADRLRGDMEQAPGLSRMTPIALLEPVALAVSLETSKQEGADRLEKSATQEPRQQPRIMCSCGSERFVDTSACTGCGRVLDLALFDLASSGVSQTVPASVTPSSICNMIVDYDYESVIDRDNDSRVADREIVCGKPAVKQVAGDPGTRLCAECEIAWEAERFGLLEPIANAVSSGGVADPAPGIDEQAHAGKPEAQPGPEAPASIDPLVGEALFKVGAEAGSAALRVLAEIRDILISATDADAASDEQLVDMLKRVVRERDAARGERVNRTFPLLPLMPYATLRSFFEMTAEAPTSADPAGGEESADQRSMPEELPEAPASSTDPGPSSPRPAEDTDK